jgi:UDP-N-acetylglucosamine:LPS N-acetylglucosamine transferase
MNILLGWELGAGQGHVQRLAALAKALEAQGFTPIFALKSYRLQNLRFPWRAISAPLLPFSGREESHTLADILAAFGFHDRNLLQPHIAAWQTILKNLNPALVIADHAPGLVLAARGLVPTVVIGSHFAVPPPIEVFPTLRFPAPPQSELYQAQVSETVHQIANSNQPLGRILNGDRSFIFSLPELDCYRFWRQDPQYVGIHNAPFPINQAKSNHSTWAYLAKHYAHRDRVLQTLNSEHEFKPLHEALVDKSLAVHHGGLTTTIACLLTGVPQLILPQHLEQHLNAIALLRLGAAQMLFNPTWEDLLVAQAQMMTFHESAKAIAQHLQPWNQNLLDIVVNACLQFLV